MCVQPTCQCSKSTTALESDASFLRYSGETDNASSTGLRSAKNSAERSNGQSSFLWQLTTNESTSSKPRKWCDSSSRQAYDPPYLLGPFFSEISGTSQDIVIDLWTEYS